MFGLYPPEQMFKITITIEQLAYSRSDGDDIWTTVSSFEIGPHKRVAKSKDFSVSSYTACHSILYLTDSCHHLLLLSSICI